MEKTLLIKRKTIGAIAAASAAGALWACSSVSGAAQTTPAAPPAQASQAPAAAAAADMAAARATFERVCGGCHESAMATDQRQTRQGWEQVVERMFGFGLAATDAELDQVVDYLTANYSPQ